jgi:hypothetical protein
MPEVRVLCLEWPSAEAQVMNDKGFAVLVYETGIVTYDVSSFLRL